MNILFKWLKFGWTQEPEISTGGGGVITSDGWEPPIPKVRRTFSLRANATSKVIIPFVLTAFAISSIIKNFSVSATTTSKAMIKFIASAAAFSKAKISFATKALCFSSSMNPFEIKASASSIAATPFKSVSLLEIKTVEIGEIIRAVSAVEEYNESVEDLPFTEFSFKSREKIRTRANKYAEYYEEELFGLRDAVIRRIEEIMQKKSLGDTLTMLFHRAFTTTFFKEIARLVRIEFMTAMDKTERETGIVPSATEQVHNEIERLQRQQVSGYKLPDGGIWTGIMGTNREIRIELGKQIIEGMNNKEDVYQISQRVRDVFDVSSSRAVRIARTESIRIANAGLQAGYSQANVPAKKQWVSKIDDRTSPICRRLNGKKVGLNDSFVDPETGYEYDYPPGHPNCRSRIIMIPE